MATLELDKISQLLGPTLSHLGYELYLVEQSGSGGRTLRIVIDHLLKPISHEDCVKVSRLVGPLLGQAMLVSDNYGLEVSSPGAERELRSRSEYDRFLGRRVKLHYRSGSGTDLLEGRLVEIHDNGVEILTQLSSRVESRVQVEWEMIIRAHLVATL
ncbi:MAG: ribosome maturation factor RimP [Candidatus Dormibacteraceae bacterium]